MRNMTRGDVVRLVDSTEKVVTVAYKPRGCTKRDQGDAITYDMLVVSRALLLLGVI